MSNSFSNDLLSWYVENARDLPWRETRDPYAIWVSEIMLQQTRVDTVVPFFQRWMAQFPTIEKLAQARIDEVLGVWEGLGYYQRAHNLHKAAGILHAEYSGKMPHSTEELVKLPGIGPYTAAAISSIAFGRMAIALDGNLRRIISRLIDYDQDASTPEALSRFRSWAMAQVPPSAVSEFNQAMMDLGALICTPKSPSCERCPVKTHCEAYNKGVQGLRPMPKSRSKVPHHVVTAGVLREGGKVLMGRRLAGELLGGLWEFPGGKCLSGETIAECLVRDWKEELDMDIVPGSEIGVIDHAYTHFKVTVHAIECKSKYGVPKARVHSELDWVTIDRLDEFPMGKVDRTIATLIRG